MINFRYHIVSLTAVFLALVIGILMGTTVVSKATVDGLKANVRRAEARSAAVHRTNDELDDELSARVEVSEETDEALTGSVLAHSVRDQLDDVPVLVIATEGVDKELIEAAYAVLDAAGARVPGTLTIGDRLGDDGTEAERLREVLGVPGRVDPRQAAARRLATVFVDAGSVQPGTGGAGTTTTAEDAAGTTAPDTTEASDPDDTDEAPDPTTAADDEDTAGADALDLLLEEGFVKFRSRDGDDTPEALRAVLDGGDNRYVVLSGPEAAAIDTNFLVPMVASMVRQGPVAQVFATGPADPVDPRATDALLGDLLDRDGVEGHVSTVDDLRSYAGDVALVYALFEAGEGRFGSYGIGELAGAVVPDIPPPPAPGSEPGR